MKNIIYSIRVILINFVILYILLFLIEIILNFNKNTLLKENKFYYRELLKKDFQDVNVAFAPYKLLNRGKNLIPLNGISNSKTILCKNNKKFETYNSDNYGFNNFNLPKKNEILFIGDSYVQGLCQSNENSLVGNLLKNKVNTINLGMMSTGPLFQYAILKEYAAEFDYDTIIWLFNPDNDFYDFSNEIKDNVLNKYFFKDDFKQNLLKYDKLKNEILLDYFDYERRKSKEFIKFYHLDLKIIRDKLQYILDKYIHKKPNKNAITYDNEKILKQIIEIKEKVIEFSKSNDKKLIFIINAIRPDIFLSEDSEIKKINSQYLQNIKIIKENLKNKEIIFFDFNQYLYSKYNKKNINDIFKVTSDGYDHYTIFGNQVLAKKILDHLKF